MVRACANWGLECYQEKGEDEGAKEVVYGFSEGRNKMITVTAGGY